MNIIMYIGFLSAVILNALATYSAYKKKSFDLAFMNSIILGFNLGIIFVLYF